MVAARVAPGEGATRGPDLVYKVETFKIAFVIFVVGHVLAPTAKHDYISIDFWAALNDISKVKDWNWGGYVLKNLFQAVKKFKADVSKRNPTVHIVGYICSCSSSCSIALISVF